MDRYSDDLSKLHDTLSSVLDGLDLDNLGKFNAAYKKHYANSRFDKFVIAEWPYYTKVINWYEKNIPVGATVLEVGMFIPIIPLLLSWRGYNVTTVENLAFYGSALDPMVEVAQKNNITFRNEFILESKLSEQFEVINLLAVVEHLTGSPRELMFKLRSMLSDSGSFVFVVPNQARLARRLGLMFAGISVQPTYADYFESAYPFEGHHREYVMSEVKYLFNESGYTIDNLEGVSYPPTDLSLISMIRLINKLLPKTMQQAFFATARKNTEFLID